MTLNHLAEFAPLLSKRQELRLQTNLTRTVMLSDGNVTTNQRSEESGAFSRAWESGAFGACSSPGFDIKGIEHAIRTAHANAKTLSAAKKSFKPLPERPGGQILAKTAFIDPKQEDLLAFALDLDGIIAQNCPGLSNRIIRVIVECTKVWLHTTHGMCVERVLPRAHVMVSLTTRDAAGLPVTLSGRCGGGGGSFCEHYGKASDISGHIDRIYKRLTDKREGVYPEAGVHDVIIDADLAGMLAHEAIGHTTESDLVRSGSVAAGSRGKRMASEKISLYDFAHTAFGRECPLPIYADDEGTLAGDVEIIKNGVLNAYMTNLQDAAYIDEIPRGNGRAFSYSDEPLVRMRNTCILPGSDKLEDMIAAIDDGYYLVTTTNGQADSTSEFMFGVSMGYKIEKGKLTKAIKDTTISGVAFDMLATADMVGPDVVWSAAGYCGKKTRLGNAMGGPAIKCRLQIGGR